MVGRIRMQTVNDEKILSVLQPPGTVQAEEKIMPDKSDSQPQSTLNPQENINLIAVAAKSNKKHASSAGKEIPPINETSESLKSRKPFYDSSVLSSGFIRCFTNPPWSAVYIDNIERGKAPFAIALSVAPGKHTIRIVKKDFEPFHDTITVAPEETTTVRIRLMPVVKEKTGP